MMKAIAAAILILAGMTLPSVARDPYRIGFLGDINGRRLGTDIHGHYNDYRHYNDLYARRGFLTSTTGSNCHRHISRAPDMRYHADTRCHRHEPWLHPSIDYGQTR